MESETRPTAMVTGGAGTLGRAISLDLVRRGYEVAVADIAWEAACQFAAEVETTGGVAFPLQLDVTDESSWKEARRELQSRWSQLDLLVNNAGALVIGDFEKLDMSQWKRIVDINLHGTAMGCHTMADWLMRDKPHSFVLNVASYTGLVPIPWSAPYTVSKSAVIALSESLAIEWAERPVSITVACPGFFPSHLFDSVGDGFPSIAAVMRRAAEKSTLTPHETARRAIDATLNGTMHAVFPSHARWQWRLKRWLPNWFLRKLARNAHAIRQRAQNRLDGDGRPDCHQRNDRA